MNLQSNPHFIEDQIEVLDMHIEKLETQLKNSRNQRKILVRRWTGKHATDSAKLT